MDIDAPTHVEATRAEGLWFEDCGLIIQAENTLFRVSRDFLATQSPVFRDMLAIPTPPDAETRDGCPFVRLPDSATDVTVFLKAMVYFDFFEAPPAETTLEILIGVLRMSHKYEVDALRKRALAHLSPLHPTTLEEWEKTPGTNWISGPWAKQLLEKEGIPLIPLARQLSLDWILPVAFYRVCQSAQGGDIINSSILTTQDKILCVEGRHTLTTENSRLFQFLSNPKDVAGCPTPHQCLQNKVESQLVVEVVRTYGGLPLDKWDLETPWRSRLCGVCLAAMKDGLQAAKRDLWDKLPELFELPP
ncbi:hypothetical protein FB45DRAFT_803973 [Roridomyces roridus]|uniref:BTB domain-containing protein n=1 Tax=Roridomyces roridus TaxID=1738132 RepID=A0AAD7FCQ3_9AGAR|nr:hypothetical protein FB45DRAFT_803973 [Roridomyces roridus]